MPTTNSLPSAPADHSNHIRISLYGTQAAKPLPPFSNFASVHRSIGNAAVSLSDSLSVPRRLDVGLGTGIAGQRVGTPLHWLAPMADRRWDAADPAMAPGETDEGPRDDRRPTLVRDHNLL